MTQKEAQRMRRLELENAQLRESIKNHLAIYGDVLMELIETRATLDLCRDALNGNRDDHA